jgi:hypothetical protein
VSAAKLGESRLGESKLAESLRSQADGRPHELVRLVTRLLIAQGVAAAAVGLPFSRRHLPSILITLALVAAVFVLAALTRTGGHATWLLAISCESAFVVFGLSRFLVARYVGGTLFGLIALSTLLQPAAARAFAVGRGAAVPAPDGLEDAADGALGGRAIG